jgi:hypothetical protein
MSKIAGVQNDRQEKEMKKNNNKMTDERKGECELL